MRLGLFIVGAWFVMGAVFLAALAWALEEDE